MPSAAMPSPARAPPPAHGLLAVARLAAVCFVHPHLSHSKPLQIRVHIGSIDYHLKGLGHEIDFKNLIEIDRSKP